MKIVRPDYTDCLTNLSNSILKYFGCKTFHDTLPDIDDILKENNSKNVVVLLLDGMGANILDRTLPENSILRKSKLRNLHSVFPPTTVAATTGFLTGLNPSEHGLLGWDLYMPKVKKIVTVFTNNLKDTKTPAGDTLLAEKYYPQTYITDMINEKYEGHILSPYKGEGYSNLNELFTLIQDHCQTPGKKFIYAYYEDPDKTCHECGTDSREMKAVYKNLNTKIDKLVSKLEDTTLIIIADHGHINSTPIMINENEELLSLLKGDVSIEGRACSFSIKSGCKEKFEELFENEYENDFILYSKKQVIDKKIFGTGKNHKYFNDEVGDYLAIGTGDKYFAYNENSTILKSMHAGMTEDEMLVPLIVITKK